MRAQTRAHTRFHAQHARPRGRKLHPPEAVGGADILGQPRTASPHSPRSRETFYRAPTPAVRLPLSPPHPERRRSRAALPQSPAPHSIPPAAAGAGAQHRGGRGGAEGRAGGGTMWQEGTPGLLPSAAICPRACPAPSAARPSLRGREEEGERYRGRKEKKKRGGGGGGGSAEAPPAALHCCSRRPHCRWSGVGPAVGGEVRGRHGGRLPGGKEAGRARVCVCRKRREAALGRRCPPVCAAAEHSVVAALCGCCRLRAALHPKSVGSGFAGRHPGGAGQPSGCTEPLGDIRLYVQKGKSVMMS